MAKSRGPKRSGPSSHERRRTAPRRLSLPRPGAGSSLRDCTAWYPCGRTRARRALATTPQHPPLGCGIPRTGPCPGASPSGCDAHGLSRIHRRTGMNGVRAAEGGEGVTGAMIRARIWVDGRLAGGLQALLGAPMAAYSGCGEPDGGIGHGKRRSRTGLARVCGDVGLAGGSVADGRRQAGSGMARSRAKARLNCSSQGQRRGRWRVNRHAERVIRPAKAKTRRLRVLVVTIC